MGLTSMISRAAGGAQQPSSPSTSQNGQAAGQQGPTADRSQDAAPEGASADDTEVLDDEPKNMLLAIAGQLRIGMDLSKITLPVFVLEPRSMLERVTDFHSHPQLLHGVSKKDSAEDRFIEVLRYYLAGWHIKPKGVKKPYNPVLGEFFRCRYDYPDGGVAYYVAEQVSHHPPISAWYFVSPDQDVEICGDLRPKSKFLGNSAATIMEGENKLRFLSRPEDGEYQITMPNMYARGILFGKMVLELGDTSTVKNVKTGLNCDIEFKTKGWVSGSYNAIGGKIKGKKGTVGDISGNWSDRMDLHRKSSSSKSEVFFDASGSEITHKVVAPEAQQSEFESRKLWSKVTQAIKAKDLDAATDAKTIIEDQQRESAKKREEKGETWQPRFFVLKDGEWRPNFTLPDGVSSQEQTQAVRKFIYGDDFEPEPTNSRASTSTSANEQSASAPATGSAAAAATSEKTTTRTTTTGAAGAVGAVESKVPGAEDKGAEDEKANSRVPPPPVPDVN